ncbi:sacsin N-terminal ATP-binding-like domain-containing protein [Agromyces laixinhei]|uniref:sacsin N-terminal ATP-binding-like domain-containing protein n=1 Tax=Agromyces laixinhei TaxID=2585717 RepID=UPI0012EDD2CD|nr:hypothetical protein [Agromyces laixinhei]
MSTLSQLTAKRRAYVDAARDNGFEEGLRKLLADLYPDNAHFIYELLQNAEDAGAHEVSFELRSDGLRFEHDGVRPFDLRDIESITGIGQSTKADDATSIGKFGVGFKAVFAYTQTPHIQSGDLSFAIHDLFVPEPAPRHARASRLTTFWFPFDRPDKPAARAVAEVSRALREISRSSLLFLSNIRLILSTFPDGDERLLERRHSADGVIEIDSVHEESGPSYWYRIMGDVHAGTARFPVAVAFALTRLRDQISNTPRLEFSLARDRVEYTVEPVDGQVFIYFPAVKETSGLKFHIHAPFASTVARDSVRDDDGNDQLISGIAELVANAMPKMRDAGLLTDGLLSALPNGTDELPERYEPVRDRLLAAFETEPITPLQGGGFAESVKLIRSESALRAALTPTDAEFLNSLAGEATDVVPAGWLPERSGRPGELLNALTAIEFGSKELSSVFEMLAYVSDEIAASGEDVGDYVDHADLEHFRRWTNWITARNNTWLRNFYAALGRLTQQSRNPFTRDDYRYHGYTDPFTDSLAEVPIVRVQAALGVAHVRGREAFLPTTPGLRGDGLVLDAFVAFGEKQTKTERAEANALSQFFSHAEVKAWDAAAQLDARLRTYASSPPTINEAHLHDLGTLQGLLAQGAVSVSSYARRSILLADSGAGLRWASAAEIYLDEPYAPSGLSALYESDTFGDTYSFRLASAYRAFDFDVATLAIRLGAATGLEIKPTPIWTNPQFEYRWRLGVRENQNMVARDWTLEHFSAIVGTYDEALLRSLWTLIARAEARTAGAAYRANGSSPVHQIDSQLVQMLKSIPWVLDSDGNLRLPADMTADDLADGMILPSNAPLLDSANFGQAAASAALRERGDEARAQTLGFESAEQAREAARAINDNPAAFAEWMRSRSGPELPEASSPAPERRAQRVREQASEAPQRQYATRLRSVRIQEPGHKSAAKGYLTGLYTNNDGAMVCQICDRELPFKVNGQYYFEAVQFVSDALRDLHENRLALCPVCAAKYRHARTTLLDELRDDLLTQSVGDRGSLDVDVELAGEEHHIRFVGKHAIDLQAALEGSEIDPFEDEMDELTDGTVNAGPDLRFGT